MDRPGGRTYRGSLPSCGIHLRAPKPLPKAYPRQLKTIGDHIRKRRLDLELRQVDVAQRLGVSVASVGDWEAGETSPSIHFTPKVIEFLGFNPHEPQVACMGGRLVAYRRRLGLTQRELARRLGFDPCTIASWERGEHKPMRRQRAILDGVLGRS